MQIFTDADSFIPTFNGEIPFCRDIDDRLIIFDRLGKVHGVRSVDSLPAVGSDFFDYMPESEVRFISDFCTVFDHDRLVIVTDFGDAMIFTAMLGACGLMFAVIPQVKKGMVFEHFSTDTPRRVLLSEAVKKASAAFDEKEALVVKSTFSKAESVFSADLMRAFAYRIGTRIGALISEKLLEISDFVGCVGSCSSSLKILPDTENFCTEIFIALCICVTAFARDAGKNRSFKANIGESGGRLLTTFCVEVDHGFKLYKNRKYSHPMLNVCDSLTDKRGIFFDCFTRQNELFISFITESDPLIGRRIKQDIEKAIKNF